MEIKAIVGAGTAAIAALAYGQTVAQDLIDGQDRPVTTVEFISNLEATDNYDLSSDSLGNALIWTNTLRIGFLAGTPTDRLVMGAQGSYRLADYPDIGNQNDLDDPRLNISYNRQVDDSALRFDGSYQNVDVAFFDPLRVLDFNDGFDNTSGGGRVQVITANFGLALNEDGPISLDILSRYLSRSYYDGADPDLSDAINSEVAAEVGFLVNPLLRATVGAGYLYRYVDQDLNTNRTTTSADVGFDARVNPRLSAEFRVGVSQVEIDDDEGTRTVDNRVGRLNFVADMPNGSISAGTSTTLDENGPRYTLSVGRNIEFRNGTLSARLGASTSDNTSVRPVGTVSYQRSTRDSSVTATLSQVATVNQDSEDVLNTIIRAGYQRNVTELTSVGVNVLGGLTRREDPDRSDSERISVQASINRTLTRDWAVSSGYTYVQTNNDGDGDAQSNTIFLTLRRSFQALR